MCRIPSAYELQDWWKAWQYVQQQWILLAMRDKGGGGGFFSAPHSPLQYKSNPDRVQGHPKQLMGKERDFPLLKLCQ